MYIKYTKQCTFFKKLCTLNLQNYVLPMKASTLSNLLRKMSTHKKRVKYT